MITVGLVKELTYISVTLHTDVQATIEALGHEVVLGISKGYLSVHYAGEYIWRESVSEDSLFGIESCDSIARIITCISNNDNSWEKYKYIE